MLLTMMMGLALVTGALAVLAVLLALLLWLIWTGRVSVEQASAQPSVGWNHVPSVLHRARGIK